MRRSPDVGYFFSDSEDSETWEGPHDSRDDAREEGIEYYPDGCWTSLGEQQRLTHFLDEDRITENIIEFLSEAAYEDCHDLMGEWPEVTPEEKADLAQRIRGVLLAWGKEVGIHDCGFYLMDPKTHEFHEGRSNR